MPCAARAGPAGQADQANPAGLSPLVAGAWRLADWGWTPAQRLGWIEALLDWGLSSVDLADSRQGGTAIAALFGQALALRPALRARLQLIGHLGLHARGPRPAAALRDELTRWLQALGTDHLDLLLLHPGALAGAPADALADTLAALRRAGRVRAIGLAHADAPTLAAWHARLGLATGLQPLSLLHPAPLHDGTLDTCRALGLRPLAWAPLAGGRLLAADAAQGAQPGAPAARVRALLVRLAAELGVSPTTLAIAWVQAQPSRPRPMLGTRRPEVARDALAALALPLAPALWQQLSAAAAAPA